MKFPVHIKQEDQGYGAGRLQPAVPEPSWFLYGPEPCYFLLLNGGLDKLLVYVGKLLILGSKFFHQFPVLFP